MADAGKKREVYNWIKVGSLLSLIPFVLACGPLMGYIAFDYLRNSFGAPLYVSYILITVGFVASVRETIRIIRITLRTK
ncbi:MAG: hypothetical protein NTZ95_03015 [Candidatus Omnitrophica bacterium]|nr:hypothetical protein [Candidatus Omnitrophota bacterium]